MKKQLNVRVEESVLTKLGEISTMLKTETQAATVEALVDSFSVDLGGAEPGEISEPYGSGDSVCLQKIYEATNRIEIMLEEALELLRSEPQRTPFRSPRRGTETTDDFRPKDVQCRHCGNLFAGPRTASICGECKSQGHTLEPRDCPRCTEGQAI